MTRSRCARPLLLSVAAALCAPACASRSAPAPTAAGAPPPDDATPADGASTGGTSAPQAAPADALLTAALITEDGAEVPVYLDRSRTLHVGDRSIPVDHIDPTGWEYAWRTQATLSVVDLDASHKAVLLATPVAEPEDPPNRYQMFLVEQDRLRRVFDRVVGVYGIQELRVPGDGTVRYTEDGWTACEREKHPARATRQEVIFRLDPAGQLTEAQRVDTAESIKCDELSACPYIYVATGDGEVFAGEILRDLRGRAAYALQPLELAVAAEGALRVRIAEEKPETTFLDEIFLEVDGRAVRPATCAASPAPAYCRADRSPLVLREGESLTLDFELPVGAPGHLRLMARGYYIPTPTAHLRR